MITRKHVNWEKSKTEWTIQYSRYIQWNKTTNITRMDYGKKEGGSNDTVGNN